MAEEFIDNPEHEDDDLDGNQDDRQFAKMALRQMKLLFIFIYIK